MLEKVWKKKFIFFLILITIFFSIIIYMKKLKKINKIDDKKNNIITEINKKSKKTASKKVNRNKENITKTNTWQQINTWTNRIKVNNKKEELLKQIEKLYIKNRPYNSIIDKKLVKCMIKWWIKNWFWDIIKPKFSLIFKKVWKYKFKYIIIKDYKKVYKEAKQLVCTWYWIKELYWLENFKFLETINLAENKIEKFPKNIFEFEYLSYINLEKNNIYMLPEITINSTWNTNIEELYLSWNVILWSLANNFVQWRNEKRKIWQLINWMFVWIASIKNPKIWEPIKYFYWSKEYVFNRLYDIDKTRKIEIKALSNELKITPEM